MMKVWSVKHKNFRSVAQGAGRRTNCISVYISGIEIVFIPIRVLDGARQFVSHKKSI
jgi:hypothetical protein